MSVLEVLRTRGFVSQCTDEQALKDLLDKETVTIYLGVDPTSSSLHIGHTVPFYALAHLYQAGHRAINLMGGGTGRIGDPSGKTEMRQMLTYEQIDQNVASIKNQLSCFFDFSQEQAIVLNNADWLADLKYIDFLRTVGCHFSVNKMLSFEAYKQRLEKGLSFIEFNYQLLQSYDFYMLNQNQGCRLQIGGDDQWGNIVAGIDLIRRMGGPVCYGLTCPLITTSDGKKMGKSEKGAVFLSADITTPYEFFQYWRNIDDRDVERFLLLFTFLSVEECQHLGRENGASINKSKERLAYEVTKQIHGELEADKALSAAHALFAGTGNLEDIPQGELKKKELQSGSIEVSELFHRSGLCQSKSDARRMILQGAITVNDEKINDEKKILHLEDIKDGGLMLRLGKKKYYRYIVRG